jgi:PAS domain S-box-containing protein
MTEVGAAAKLRAAFELSPTILAVTSLDDGRLLEVNDAFLRATGYTREEIIGRPIPEIGIWADPSRREAGLAGLRQGRPVRDMEAHFRTKRGDELVTIANADVVEVDGQRFVLTALMDITSRVRAEAALRETERRFAQAFHANPLPMSITSLADGRHLDVNEAAVRHSGYTREEMLGRTKPELGFWVEGAQRDELVRLLQADGRARDVEVTFKTKAGELRQLLVNSEVVTYGGAPAVLSVSLDITDRKQAEVRQRDAERTSRFLAEASRVLTSSLDYESTLQTVARLAVPEIADWCGVHVVESTGDIRCVATAHADATTEAVGRELLARYPPRPWGRYGVPLVIRTGQSLLRREVPDDVITAFGRTPEELAAWRGFSIGSIMIVPLVARGRTLGAMTFLTVVSARRYEAADLQRAEDLAARAALAVDNARLYADAEARRREAEAANRGKDDFLAVLSHELRTPLQAMLGWLRLLRAGRLDAVATAKALETVERNTQAQTKLIGDLLDVSGILAGKLRVEPRPTDLVGALEAAVQSVRATAEARNIGLRTDVGGAEMIVDGDPFRIDQVLGNLLSNALKFTPAGGTVAVTLHRSAADARLTVADTGIGIAPDVLPHVFDRFRQADSSTTRTHGGLGLGLALVRYLVEAHGGSVVAASPGIGRGATFIVSLPLRTGDAAVPSVPDAAALGDARVLIVDADPDTRHLLSDALRSAGLRVITAASANQALAEPCDVVVIDLSTPGDDGFTLVRRLRELDAPARRRRPALALTAHARADDRRRALEAGFDAYLVKPVDGKELVARVVRLLQPR